MPETTVNRTPLAARHEASGAVMGGFAGWWMPIRFAGVVAEHQAVRTSVGVFDVSHLGIIEVTGPQAMDVMAVSFTNDPSRIGDGASQYTLCCDERGGVIDDLLVYRLAPDRWVAVPNAANTPDVLEVLVDVAASRDAVVDDRSTRTAVLAVQGPGSVSLLDEAIVTLAGPRDAASSMAYLAVGELELAGGVGLLARTGYTGEPGAELVVDVDVAEAVWDAVCGAGAVPCGLGARDTLRLEMGYPLHGHELSRDVTPYEGGVGWAVKTDREDFRGREALLEAKRRGPRRALKGLVPAGRRPVRDGMTVSRGDTGERGGEAGVITSGTVSPTLGHPIAMARLDPAIAFDDVVQVDVRGRPADARVVRTPFVRRDPRGSSGTAS